MGLTHPLDSAVRTQSARRPIKTVAPIANHHQKARSATCGTYRRWSPAWLIIRRPKKAATASRVWTSREDRYPDHGVTALTVIPDVKSENWSGGAHRVHKGVESKR